MPFTDTSAVEKVVFNVVVNWLVDNTTRSLKQILNDLDGSLSGAPLDGYRLTKPTYNKMCADASSQLQKTLGRLVNLDPDWRDDHVDDPVNGFISAVTIEIVNSSLTKVGKGALAWSIAKQGVQRPD
jgi:hypothetical protein